MRPTAVLPALLSAAALVLAFLCLFAGHKKDFMEDYNVLTLNVSRLGEGLVNGSLGSDQGALGSLWDLVPDSIQSDVGEAAEKVAEELGIEVPMHITKLSFPKTKTLQDFYSAHLLTYCSGQYTPTETPNASIPLSAIRKNLTFCSPARAMFWFDPSSILEHALNASGLDVTLSDLEWPDDIDRGLATLRAVQQAAFVLYCVAIALISVVFAGAVAAVFASGRLSACVNFLIGALAFLAIGLASALVTAVIEKGADVVNEHGQDVGVQAVKGRKFLAITWVSTGLVFLSLVYWVVEVCVGGKRRKAAAGYAGGKHG